MRFIVRVLPTAIALLVATAGFVLSFVAQQQVAIGLFAVPAALAWLVPVVVDGTLLSASASLWASSYMRQRRDPTAYILMVTLLAFSVVVNVFHAGRSGAFAPGSIAGITPAAGHLILARAIAALPPIALLGCMELVASAHRRDFQAAEAARAAEQRGDQASAEQASAEQAVEAPPTPVAPAAAPLPSPAAPPQPRTTGPAAPAPSPQPPREPSPRTASTAPAGNAAAPSPAAPPAPAVVQAPASAITKPAPLRLVATAPATPRPSRQARAAAPASAVEGGGAAAVAAAFRAHLSAGGDAGERGLVHRIAAELGLSDGYVRAVVKPLRDELGATSSAASA